MIRRFFTFTVFVTTVFTAAFGQNIFGREDLIRWGHRIQAEAPARTQKALKQADVVLASLAPEAGTAADNVCTYETLAFAVYLHSRNIRT